MDKQGPEGFQRLDCSCGQNRFARVTHLRWRQGAGVTEEPGGYFCLECHGVVNTADLINRAQVKAKRAELRQLEDELGTGMPEPKVAVAAGAEKKK